MDFAPANEHPLDPFPQYERMRETAPVFHDEQSGSWHVFRYDDVQRALSEHASFLLADGRRRSIRDGPAVRGEPDHH